MFSSRAAALIFGHASTSSTFVSHSALGVVPPSRPPFQFINSLINSLTLLPKLPSLNSMTVLDDTLATTRPSRRSNDAMILRRAKDRVLFPVLTGLVWAAQANKPKQAKELKKKNKLERHHDVRLLLHGCCLPEERIEQQRNPPSPHAPTEPPPPAPCGELIGLIHASSFLSIINVDVV